jgi:hypothetical protein
MREILAVLVFCVSVAAPAAARDDGRYANDPLHAWFDQLGSGRGLCCSFADGRSIEDVDWDTQDGHYRVRLQGEWVIVPEDGRGDPTKQVRSGSSVAVHEHAGCDANQVLLTRRTGLIAARPT